MCALTWAVRLGLAMSKKEDAPSPEGLRANQQGTIWRSLAGGGGKLEIQPHKGGCYEIRDLSDRPGRLCVREGREPLAAEKGRLRGMRGEFSERRCVVPWGRSSPSDADQRLHEGQRILRSSGPRGEQAGFCLQLAASDLLQLELAQSGRIFAPPRNAALLNTERFREFGLRPVVLDGFLSRHI
jgi:hypothetical protein